MAEWKKVIVSGSNAVLNTLSAPGGVTANLSGNVTGNVTGDLTGTASIATKLTDARTFSLTGGDVTATGVTFDGTGNVSLNANIGTGVIDTNMFASATKTNISGAFAAASASLAAAIVNSTYDLDVLGDNGGAGIIITNEEALTIAGGNGITTNAATNTVTISIDSSITTTASFATYAGNAFNATAAASAVNATSASFATYANTAGAAGTATTAGTATQLANARTFSLTGGDVTATGVTFDGTGNVALNANIGNGTIDTVMFATATKADISGAFTAASASLAAAIVNSTYDLDVLGDNGGAGIIITNEEALTIAGGNGIVTSASGNTLTITAAEGVVSASSFSSPSQGTVRATVNGVQTDVDTGLQTGDSPTFASLTLTGDLVVQGTRTELNVTNLNVEDQFIMMNSGSVAADAGIVVEGQGTAFGWDESASRWGFDFSGATYNQTTLATDAYAAAVVTTDDANYRYNGNIRVTSGEIFIYVE